MKKTISKGIIYMMGAALLLFTSWRTLHLINSTLPDEQWLLGMLALVAFGVGLVGWAQYFSHGAENTIQFSVAVVMVVIDLAGEVIAFSFDTILTAQTKGMIDKLKGDPEMIAIIVMAAVVALNIIALLIVHLASNENLKAIKEGMAHAKIEEATLKEIDGKASVLAAEIAPKIGAAWAESVRIKYAPQMLTGDKTLSIANEYVAPKAEEQNATVPLLPQWMVGQGGGNGKQK